MKNNHWVTTGAAFLLMGATLGLGGCDDSASTTSSIISQPAVTPSPQVSPTTKTNAPPAVVPPVTIETKSQQPSPSAKSPSKQNTPSPGATNQQPMTTEMPAPKIRVNPDAALSPQLVIDRGGKTSTFNAQDFRSEVMGSINCQKMEQVDRQTLTVTNFMRDQVSMNPRTGEIAIGVIFQYCALTQESAVVVLKSNSDGSYQPRMLQVPGKQALPSNNATYPLGYIKSLRYTNNNLLVNHGSAAGAEAELEFRDGQFASCRVTVVGEGEQKVCP